MADAATDAAIAAAWPERWNAVKDKPGKGRTKVRRMWQTHLLLEALREKGARCANCLAYSPSTPQLPNNPPHCEAHSDFDGYQIAEPDGLCTDWKARQ